MFYGYFMGFDNFLKQRRQFKCAIGGKGETADAA